MAVTAETVEQGPKGQDSQSDSNSGSNWFRSRVGQPSIGETQEDSNSNSETVKETVTTTETDTDASSEQTKSSGDSEFDAAEAQASQASQTDGPRTFTVTADQLDRAFNQRLEAYLQSEEYKRTHQSEVDKAIAARNKQAKREAVERLADETSEDYNPHAYLAAKKELEAEEQKEHSQVNQTEEQFKAASAVMVQTGRMFDDNIVSPVLALVPAPLRKELAAVRTQNLSPVDERKALVMKAVELIRKDAGDKRERELRNNQAFRKQLLLDERAEEDEVDVRVGTVAPVVSEGGSENERMNNLFRSAAGRAPRR